MLCYISYCLCTTECVYTYETVSEVLGNQSFDLSKCYNTTTSNRQKVVRSWVKFFICNIPTYILVYLALNVSTAIYLQSAITNIIVNAVAKSLCLGVDLA